MPVFSLSNSAGGLTSVMRAITGGRRVRGAR